MDGPPIAGFDFASPGDALLAQRRVMLSGALDATVVNDTVARLLLLDGSGTDPIQLLVSTGSGALEPSLALLDTMRSLRSQIEVDVMGSVEGAAAVLVAVAGGRRRLGATGSVSLRLPERSVEHARTADELQRLADERDGLETRIAGLVAARSGRAVEWVRDEFRRGGAHFGADAVEAGLVDELR